MGTKHLINHLWLNDFLSVKEIPSEEAYRKACNKVPLEVVAEMLHESHKHALTEKNELFHEMPTVLVDGSKFIIPRSDKAVSKYGLGSGTAEAYYPQVHLGGFLDISTGTFSHVNIDHGVPAERQMLLEHAEENKDKTLYIADAGYNGMAFITKLLDTGNHILMELKMGAMLKNFRKLGKRSKIIEVKLTRVHLLNYPECKHMIGRKIKIRLIKARGTTKLKSKILITTLLDEKIYKWQKLSEMYLHRWKIEIAFRHIKVNMRAEHIQKQSLLRIQQLLLSAFILFNISAIIRNQVQKQVLSLRKKGEKIISFSYVIDKSISFLKELLFRKHGSIIKIRKILKSIKECYFIYAPWRTRPKICQFPTSVFTRCKSTEKASEFAKCEAIKQDMILMGKKYGQIKKSA